MAIVVYVQAIVSHFTPTSVGILRANIGKEIFKTVLCVVCSSKSMGCM